MNESQSITQFKNDLFDYLEADPIHYLIWHKISDGGYSSGFNRFSSDKFVDVVGGIDGTLMALEFKIHKTHLDFHFDKIPDHQMDTIFDVDESGGIAYIVIHQFVNLNGLSAMKTNDLNIMPDHVHRNYLSRLFFFEAKFLKMLKNINDEKSFSLNKFSSMAIGRQVVGRKLVWNMKKVLSRIIPK